MVSGHAALPASEQAGSGFGLSPPDARLEDNMSITLRQRIRALVPKPIYNAQLIARRAPRWEQAGIIFVHVPKNGGTSLNTALYGRFMGHYSVRELQQHVPERFKRLPSFALTRNPWSRALSAYRFVCAGDQMTAGPKILNPGRYQIPAFDSFERFILEWLPAQDLRTADFVFRTQENFVRDRNGNMGVSFLGRLEDPAGYGTFLEETLGRKLDIPYINRTSATSEHDTGYRKSYSSEMRDMVARLYADDLNLASYDF